MKETISMLAQNPWIIVLSAFITFISLFVAIILYFKGKKIKKPRVAIHSINLLRDTAEKIDGLEILFSGESIPNVTVTKLAIWNQGNDTINGDDIAHGDPLIIKSKGDFIILDSKIIFIKNESNVIKLQEIETGKQIALLFDYLDYGEGAVIQILHTGNSSEDIEFSGTVKGVGKVNTRKRKTKISISLRKVFSSYKFPKKVIGLITIITGICAPLLFIFLPDSTLQTLNGRVTVVTKIAIGVSGLIYVVLGYIIFRQGVPKGFEIFDENI